MISPPVRCELSPNSVTQFAINIPIFRRKKVKRKMSGDEPTEGGGGLKRMDSMASPKIMDGEKGNFPVQVSPKLTRSEPSDHLFAVPPHSGKWSELISRLITKGSAGDHMNKGVAEELCADASATLKAENSLLEINLTESDQLIVCGDVHGQFVDLIRNILTEHKTVDRKFLFLGDYVDRGPMGVEVIMLLLALKVEYPNNVFLLRGNHEDAQTSRIYGFFFEVRTKFNEVSVWARFNEVFCFLPLAALVIGSNGKRFLGVHGGLSPALQNVQMIKEIDRFDYGGMLDNENSSIVDGLLWSDPTLDIPQFRPNERGCGYAFGPAATKDFCGDNELEFICRAHQMTMEGYTWAHSNQCLTLFSAPNYCGISQNLGAIMFVANDLSLSFFQFDAAPINEAEESEGDAPAKKDVAYFE